MKDSFYLRVKNYIQAQGMLRPGEAVVAGVSGGADSVCLLLLLHEMAEETGFVLHAVHVNHGLRESAGEDQRYVQELCAQHGIPCTCVQEDAAACAARWGTGVEEAGRRIRYMAFEECRAALEAERGAPCRIAVAHHLEDQAETVLFHLCRGTDLRGARGMRPVSGRIIRPLLEETRSGIEDWLTRQGIAWRTDETNTDTAYTRNFLRREILPRLTEKVNAAASSHLAGFAKTAGEAERYMEDRTEEALARCLHKQEGGDCGQTATDRPPSGRDIGQTNANCGRAGTRSAELPEGGQGKEPIESPPDGGRSIALKIPALLREDPYILRRVLFHCLAACAGSRRDLESVHVEALCRLCAGRENGRLSMPGGVTAVRQGELLYFGDVTDTGVYPTDAAQYSCLLLDYDGNAEAIPRNQYTKWFDYDKIGTFPVFRTRQAGDRMTLLGGPAPQGTVRKKLARIMLDGRVPAQVRDSIVLPFAGQEALWVPGLRMSDAFRITPETKKILQISWEEPHEIRM